MTALGKALTFFNVLFAIVTGVLIVVVFITRTNWRVGMERWEQEAKAAKAALESEKQASIQKKNDAEEQKKKLVEEIASLNKTIRGKDEEVKTEKDRAAGFEVQLAKYGQISTAGTAEIGRLQVERNQMADQLKKLTDEHAKTVNELANTSSRETYADLRAKALEQNLIETREKLAGIQRRYEELRARQPAGGAGADPNPPRRPSIETNGEVSGISGNLAQITLGSDNGIERGHILQVYRPDLKNPANSLYLGTLTVDRTQPHAAVGTFEPAGRGKMIQKGDKVDTRILR